MNEVVFFALSSMHFWTPSIHGLTIPFEELAKSYDSTIIPRSRGPLRVNVSLLIDTLDVDDARQMIRISGELQSEWDDIRLRFTSSTGPQSAIGLEGRRGHSIMKYLWLPDLTIVGGRELNPPHMRDFLRIESDGHMILTQRMDYEFPCKFDLHHYPLGEQECELKIQSTGYDVKQLEPHWESDEAVFYQDALVSPRYEVTDIETTGVAVVTIHRTKRQLQALMILQSMPGWPIKNIILPFVTTVVTAYMSFFISPSGLTARMVLCCTSFLLASMFHISTFSKTPQAAITLVNLEEDESSSAIEIFTGTCLFFIWMAIAETIAVHILSHSQSSNLLTNSNASVDQTEMIDHCSSSPRKLAALWLDRGFMIVYPVIFLAFNAVFWIIHQ